LAEAATPARIDALLEAPRGGVSLADLAAAPTSVLVRTPDSARLAADQVWMPSPLDVVRKVDAVTGPFAYVRLLGDRNAVDALTPTLDHTVIDRSEQLRADAEAIRQLSGRVRVFVYVNNHFAGYAPATVEQLRRALWLPG
jgi:uncharacterized protein YecE (DUF72 family)